MVEETDFENGIISNFQRHVTLTLILHRAIWHTVVHHSLTSTYTAYFMRQIGETFCGCTDVRTDVCTDGWTDIEAGFIRLTSHLEEST